MSTGASEPECPACSRPWGRIGLLLLLALGPDAHAATRIGHGDARARPLAGDRVIRLRDRGAQNTFHDCHYLFGTSAIPLEAGRGYYQMHDVVMQSASFAPVQGLSFGGGMQVASVISSLAAGRREPFVYARLQAGGPLADGALHLGGFAMAARTSVTGLGRDGPVWPSFMGIGAGQATVGGERLHITLSAGGLMDQQGLRDGPLLGVAALWRMSRAVALLTENWQLPLPQEPYRVHALGVRWTYRAMACDAAFAFNGHLLRLSPVGLPVLALALRL